MANPAATFELSPKDWQLNAGDVVAKGDPELGRLSMSPDWT